jgi:hypothetical protein
MQENQLLDEVKALPEKARAALLEKFLVLLQETKERYEARDKEEARNELIEFLEKNPVTFPPDFKFNREEANERR